MGLRGWGYLSSGLHFCVRGGERKKSVVSPLLHDKDKGPIYSLLDSQPGMGNPRPSR